MLHQTRWRPELHVTCSKLRWCSQQDRSDDRQAYLQRLLPFPQRRLIPVTKIGYRFRGRTLMNREFPEGLRLDLLIAAGPSSLLSATCRPAPLRATRAMRAPPGWPRFRMSRVRLPLAREG